MGSDRKRETELLAEIEDLRNRLGDAEEALRAIREGEVDGLVVSGPEGDRLFLLKGAGHAYRVFVEAMNDGAVTLSHDGTILYCNNSFADMIETDYGKVVGQSIYRFIVSRDAFESAFERGKKGKEKVEVLLKRKDKGPLPVYLSLNPLLEDEVPGICVVVIDLEALKESEKHLKHLSSELLTAQENERRRVSYDLHDNVWQMLVTIRFEIERLFSGQNNWALLHNKSKQVMADILGVVGKIRAMQGDLWPYVLDDIGLLATIEWYCREFEKNHSGLGIEIKNDFADGEIPSLAKIVIYRILQETLSNIAKHSQARHVTIHLMKKNHGMEFTVQDNGIGFDPEETIAKRTP